ALLAYRHGPVHRFAAGQELGLGQDRRPGAALVATVAAALALGFQPGRAGHALHLVPRGARLAGLDDGDDAVFGGLRLAGAAAATAPATPAGQRLLAAVRVGRLLLVLGLGRLVLGIVGLVGAAAATPAAASSPPAAA